jgi:hypothetical protein
MGIKFHGYSMWIGVLIRIQMTLFNL